MKDDWKKYLKEDEQILWEQKKEKNLLSIIPFSMIINSILILLFSLFLLINTFVLESAIGVIITLIIFIPAIIWVIWYTIHTYKQRMQILKLNPIDLKKYEFFDIITNLRYIRRNYFLNFLKDLSKYPKEAIEQVDDIIFLKLSFIEKVIINHNVKRILFIINGYKTKYEQDTNFFIEYKKNEFKELLDVLKVTLKLELKEENLGREEYIP